MLCALDTFAASHKQGPLTVASDTQTQAKATIKSLRSDEGSLADEQVGHHAKFDSGAGFICLEGKGLSRTPRKIKRFSSLRCLI